MGCADRFHAATTQVVSAPIVVGAVVVLGSVIEDRPSHQPAVPGSFKSTPVMVDGHRS